MEALSTKNFNRAYYLFNKAEYEYTPSEKPAAGASPHSEQQMVMTMVSFLGSSESYAECLGDDWDETDDRMKSLLNDAAFRKRLNIIGIDNDNDALAYLSAIGISPTREDDIDALWKAAADNGDAYALYRLTLKKIEENGAPSQELMEDMIEAYRRGSGHAAWFLFEAARQGECGMKATPEAIDALYGVALAQLNENAWKGKLEQAETDAERLLALIHMAYGESRVVYMKQYDDALRAYAEAHPETASVVATLRFLYLSSMVAQRNLLKADTQKELSTELLNMALSHDPDLLTEKEVAYHRDLIAYQYTLSRDSERCDNKTAGLSALKENSADVVLLRDGEIVKQWRGGVADALAQDATVWKKADVVLRALSREEAEMLVQAGVNAVTALEISNETCRYLWKSGVVVGRYCEKTE